jgi:hypothetical protein
VSLTLPAAAGTVLAGTNNSSGQHQPEVIQGLAARYNEEILDTTVSWANSAASGTAVTATLTFGNDRVYATGRRLLIYVRNPSTQTALNAALQVQATDNVTARWGLYADFGPVASNNGALSNGDGEWFIVEGGLVGEAVRVWFSNINALNSSGAFSARVIVRHI